MGKKHLELASSICVSQKKCILEVNLALLRLFVRSCLLRLEPPLYVRFQDPQKHVFEIFKSK